MFNIELGISPARTGEGWAKKENKTGIDTLMETLAVEKPS